MEWKQYCKGFAFEKSKSGWEEKILSLVAAYYQIPFRAFNKVSEIPDGWVPAGTVSWVSDAIGETITPDYFPNFLKPYITRYIWKEEKWPLRKVFIKPADRHKRFTGFVTSGRYNKRKKGPFWCSEIVSFQNEWRYYVINGKLLGAHWYWGVNDDPVESPKLDIQWPSNWCGTADFGTLPDGRIELIECHPPFACGWYGKDKNQYAEFIVLGWKWLMERQYKTQF